MIAHSPPRAGLDAARVVRRAFLWVLAATALATVFAGAAFVQQMGGLRAVRTVFSSWRDPGSIAFAARASRPAAPIPALAAPTPGSGSFWPHGWWRLSAAAPTPDPTPTPGEEAFDDQDRMYVLVLGLDYNHDARGIRYTRGARTDTIMVAALDRHADGLTLLSVPRDMRVSIPGHGEDKINSAWTVGGRDLTVQTVEQFLGIHVDHVAVVKPYAAEHLVDALGGVDLDVEKSMDYDDNWGGLHIHLKKGPQHLNGRQAVGYIRFRHDEEGDRGRMRRQQQFIATLLKQVKRIDTISRLPQVQDAFRQDVETTLSYEQLIDLAMLYKGFDRRKLRAVSLGGDDAMIGGVYYMMPDERQKRQAVARLRRRT